MMLFDTHCHFETRDSDEISAILVRAKAAGVEKLMAVGGSTELNASAIAAAEVAKRAKGELPSVLVAVGFDRDQIGETGQDVIESLNAQISTAGGKVATVGEIGLDYHYAPGSHREQTELFAAQLEEARKLNLPVVIHTRQAAEDTISILREIPSRGIIHCFTGEPSEAAAYLDLGFFVSISGIATFKAADNVRRTALYVPDDRILIETDSPFLAPVPLRGKTNEPAFIRHTCEFLAELRGMSSEDFAKLTFANAERALQQ